LRKSQEVIGLPIIYLSTGKKVGTVYDLLFDGDSQQFRGVVLERGDFMKKRKYIPSDHITSIGTDAVVVDSEASILPIDQIAKAWISLLSGEQRLRGRPVLLSNGCALGMVENVYFLEEMGTLIGYEISDGLLHDLQYGRKMLQSDQPLLWGVDVLIAPAGETHLLDAR
jgi:uncharacterized protein YrrD